MKHHPDRHFVNDVLNDIQNGVNIGYTGELVEIEQKNWPSTKVFENEVNEFIEKHKKNGSIEGPYEIGNSKVSRTSPLGAFQKRNSVKTRVIHDLSWPVDRSINDGINAEDFSVTYSKVSDAVVLCEK